MIFEVKQKGFKDASSLDIRKQIIQRIETTVVDISHSNMPKHEKINVTLSDGDIVTIKLKNSDGKLLINYLVNDKVIGKNFIKSDDN